MRTGIFLLLLTLVVFLIARAEETSVSGEVNRTFGIVEAYYQPEEAADLGVTWERMIFAWNEFQPNGPDDFYADAVPPEHLDQALAANREVVGLIKGTPAWASVSGSVGAVPQGIELPFDHPDNVYGAFVRRLVRYYSARGIHNWIIHNEPDVRAPHEGNVVEFAGELDDYFAMLKVAYRAAHSVDHDAHIQIAGMAFWSDWVTGRPPYLYRLLQRIAEDPEAAEHDSYFDGISVHVYFTTSTVWLMLDAYDDMLDEFNLEDKQIWITEFNASPRRDPIGGLDAPFRVSLQQQSNYIVQASALALAAGVDRLAVYRLFDDNFIPGMTEPWGLVRYDGSRRPAFYAYRQVIERFTGTQRARRYSLPEATVVTLAFPEHTLYVMWSDTYESGQFIVNAGSSDLRLMVFDAQGRQWEQSVVRRAGAYVALIDAPPAEEIDIPWVVVAGPVRMVEIEGRPRSVWFRRADGHVAQFN
jgi:hypothetical protein